ncbi:hypothetical protein F4803DRAFT_572519 [Xylaria telfairii]|nr:hypothetical protein F4803DRAFT_572519 [Xylaria telfairii]
MNSQQHARRRASPPGDSDPMEGVEFTALISERDSRPEQEETGESSKPPASEAKNDPETGWEDLQDYDNVPVRHGDNATTIGFEFELLVAVCRSEEDFPDPHPNDSRWLSDRLINKDLEPLAFRFTCRNKIVDLLNEGGVVAHKTKEFWHDERSEGFEYWDSLEYEAPNQNDQIVLSWVGKYEWNGVETEDRNIELAVQTLGRQFVDHHRNNDIELHMTTQAVLRDIRDKLIFMIQGLSTREGRMRTVMLWYEQVTLLVKNEKRKHYSATSEDYQDPDSVHIDLARTRYTAWSVTEDISIQNPMTEHYLVPDGTVPLIPNLSGTAHVEPPELYKWFPAEVVSSVLDYDNPRTRETLRTACKILRGELRIHKPSQFTRTGVHVHIGQQAGWSLLHLKKFATLWHMLEPSMYRLHRKDRLNSKWCKPMAEESQLARFIFRGAREFFRNRGDQYQATTTGPLRKAYQVQMQNHIPDLGDRTKLQEYLTNIWQYKTINELNAAMATGLGGQACVRWRIEGKQLSEETGPCRKIQTLEFRLCQGTLDAEHIWKWTSILERVVIFARDSTAEDFRITMQNLLDGFYPDLIGFNQADVKWFESRGVDGYFAYPDPDGKVDWTDPFMIRGYGDTHDDAFNP